MIEVIFRINHPQPNNNVSQKDWVLWSKRLSKNWASELQISRMPLRHIFNFHIDTSWAGKDHAGPLITIQFFNFFFDFKIYNINHWNWDAGRFYTDEEAKAEYKELMDWYKENNIEPYDDDKYAKWKDDNQNTKNS